MNCVDSTFTTFASIVLNSILNRLQNGWVRPKFKKFFLVCNFLAGDGIAE